MTGRWGPTKGLLALCCAVMLVLVAAAATRSAGSSSLDAEAESLAAQPFARQLGKPVIVVTGSSTVRLWRNSAKAFPDAQVVNTGFGGSTMDSLARHYDGLIGRYSPDLVFIGSGDNDLASGRTSGEVIADTTAILDRIRSDAPDTQVAIVAAKPSIKRWHLRERYEQLNEQFLDLARQREGVVFVDVWHRLLDRDGQVRPDLYVADGLHLNSRGYRIYSAALRTAEVTALASRPSAGT